MLVKTLDLSHIVITHRYLSARVSGGKATQVAVALLGRLNANKMPCYQ